MSITMDSVTRDLYKILGLEKNASKDEIKRAYRILSLKYHPDKNQMKDTTLVFQSINDSYSILYDDNKRREYDSSFYTGHLFRGGYDVQSSNSFHKLTPQQPGRDMRGMVFGGGTQGGNNNIHIVNCPEDISSFVNSSANGYQPFPYNTFYNQHPHPRHNNNNNIMPEEPTQPPRSSLPITIIKDLEITIEQSYNGCDIPIEIVRWVYDDNIKKEERETLYVSIQRGIDDNEVIELKHKGNVLNEQTKGDVKIFIRVKNDTIFTRNGLDLHVKHNVTLKEALCGFSFNLTFINKKMFKINNGPGNIITPGFNKIIKNMGMVRSEKTGSLVIEFSVEFPTQLTGDQIDALGLVFT
jgi:DnaJ-class molecular chaperone